MSNTPNTDAGSEMDLAWLEEHGWPHDETVAHVKRLMNRIERLTATSEASWTCSARKQSLPEPADCDWPLCGCDPHADKVIEALNEGGFYVVPGEPNEAMMREGADYLSVTPGGATNECAGNVYRAMVERSQKP